MKRKLGYCFRNVPVMTPLIFKPKQHRFVFLFIQMFSKILRSLGVALTSESDALVERKDQEGRKITNN